MQVVKTIVIVAGSIIAIAIPILAAIGALGIAVTRAGEDMRYWDRCNDNDDRMN